MSETENTEKKISVKKKAQPGKIEHVFEHALWATRYIVILPILFSLIGAIIMFVIGSIDVYTILHETIGALFRDEFVADLHTDVIVTVIGAIDVYLIAIVLLIFSFGVYELFISKIDPAEHSEASNILDIHSLDSLKDKLSQVIVMALIVKFFQMVFTMHGSYVTPTDMIMLSASILGLGICLFFLYRSKTHGKEHDEK